MSDLETGNEVKCDQQTRLKKAWNAVPQATGWKGCALDAHKEIMGVLAICEDGTLILHRQDTADFVVVSGEEASDWRISPLVFCDPANQLEGLTALAHGPCLPCPSW